MRKRRSVVIMLPMSLLFMTIITIIIGIVVGNISLADTSESTKCSSSADGKHNVIEATCTNPKMCKKCGMQFSEILQHQYAAATCTEPKTCIKCKTVDGKALGHIEGTHINGGICSRCNIKYQNHNQSTVVSRYEINDNVHIPIYACEHTGCGVTYKGTGTQHNILAYSNNENGMHSGTCIDCSYKLTENHTNEFEQCTKCNYINNISIQPTDTTQASEVIPQTGEKNIILISSIIIFIVITTILAVNLKKYRDII